MPGKGIKLGQSGKKKSAATVQDLRQAAAGTAGLAAARPSQRATQASNRGTKRGRSASSDSDDSDGRLAGHQPQHSDVSDSLGSDTGAAQGDVADGLGETAETGAVQVDDHGPDTHRPLHPVGFSGGVAPVKRVGMQRSMEFANKRKEPVGRPRINAEAQADRVAQKHVADMTACDDVRLFAQKFVWQHPETEPLDSVGPAVNASQAALSAYVARQREDAAAASDFWFFGAWPAALHIGFAWMGLGHTKSPKDKRGPNRNRSRWHLVFVAAAIHSNTLGYNRTHAFVTAVWNLTMRDSFVHKMAFNQRTGSALKQALDGSLWADWAPPSCARAATYATAKKETVEGMFNGRVRSNSGSAQSRHLVGSREAIKELLYSGTIPPMLAPWDAGNVLGDSRGSTEDAGPWWPDRNIERIANNTHKVGSAGRVSYVPNMHHRQNLFITGLAFVLYNPGAATTACHRKRTIATEVYCFVILCSRGIHL